MTKSVIDLPGFFRELDELGEWLQANRDEGDVGHMLKVERWGRAATILGYATCWLGVHPIAFFGIALGIYCRWTPVAHHILHRGYDKFKTMPNGKTSRGFGTGRRRLLDWCDWFKPEFWVAEHNLLHHYRLGEAEDPDVPETNGALFVRWPAPLRFVAVILAAVTWKWTYFAPSNVVQSMKMPRNKALAYNPLARAVWDPTTRSGRTIWTQIWAPYAALRFGLFPLPFLLLGTSAWVFALVNTVIAELITNAHSFITVVTNHSGGDIPRFTEPPADRHERLLRQIVGTVNFRTGGDLNDFMHGWLNYQIEHHVWPDLSLREYQKVQPRLEALCARYGVPYLSESVWRRTWVLFQNLMGWSRMTCYPTAADFVRSFVDPTVDASESREPARGSA